MTVSSLILVVRIASTHLAVVIVVVCWSSLAIVPTHVASRHRVVDIIACEFETSLGKDVEDSIDSSHDDQDQHEEEGKSFVRCFVVAGSSVEDEQEKACYEPPCCHIPEQVSSLGVLRAHSVLSLPFVVSQDDTDDPEEEPNQTCDEQYYK